MEVKTAYYSSVGIKMEWFSDPFKSIVFRLSFVKPPQYREELNTPWGFSVLLDPEVCNPGPLEPQRLLVFQRFPPFPTDDYLDQG